MNFKFEALLKLAPNANFYIEDDVVTWNSSDITQPTEEVVQAKIVELKAEYKATQYQRDRLKEYPDLQECIHAILDDDLTALQAKRKLIKDKFPKPE